jgi:hypothetical protein
MQDRLVASQSGPADQNMDIEIASCDSVDYVQNMTFIFASWGMRIGGGICFALSDRNTAMYPGVGRVSTPASDRFKSVGECTGAPLACVFGLFGCGVGTVTSPVVCCAGQPEIIKTTGHNVRSAFVNSNSQ